MLQDDYIMRRVEMLADSLARIIFRKTSTNYQLPEESEFTQTDFLYHKLQKLLAQGQINEAENLLYDELDPEDLRGLELAIDFYLQLNQHDNQFLEDHDYSREEVEEGLQNAAKLFGVTL